MDNKVTKKRISLHFEYDWLKYVLVLLASILIFYLVYWQINVTREFEKLDIYFSTYQNNNGTKLSDEFKAHLSSKGDDIIRDVNISYQDPATSTYGALTTTNSYTSDIMILTEKDMKLYGYDYVEINDDIWSECVPDGMEVERFVFTSEEVELAQFNGKTYGIRIDNLKKLDNSVHKANAPFIFDLRHIIPEDEMEGFEAYDTKFYLTINPNSVNIGKYGKDKNYRHLKQTFEFIRYFLNTYNV